MRLGEDSQLPLQLTPHDRGAVIPKPLVLQIQDNQHIYHLSVLAEDAPCPSNSDSWSMTWVREEIGKIWRKKIYLLILKVQAGEDFRQRNVLNDNVNIQ